MKITKIVCMLALTGFSCFALFRFAELVDGAWYVLLNPDYSCEVPVKNPQ